MFRRFFRAWSEKLFGNEGDRLLKRAKRRKAESFLLFWNRGLGDIALGLYQVIAEIRAGFVNAEITVVTRPELADAFLLLPVDRVLVDEKLMRVKKHAARSAFERLNIRTAEYDVVLDHIDPTRWFAGRTQRLPPKLAWPTKFDVLWERFDPLPTAMGESLLIVAAHVQSETGAFYGYRKDWPIEAWQTFFARLGALRPVRFILFGNHSNADFDNRHCIDLRGKTSFLEMMSLIKNRCGVLIAPDSGVLTMSYYLDASFPLDVVSLWADPRQGILNHRVPSPNPLLRHVPLLGDDERVENIRVEQVLDAVSTLTATRLQCSPMISESHG